MTFSPNLDVRVTDTSLRDGAHRHRFTVEQATAMVSGMDAAGVPVIEVARGGGLGADRGGGHDERELIAAACRVARRATIASLIVPGTGTSDDIEAAHALGVGLLRVATHCSEAAAGAAHLEAAQALGMETAGFLMMSHALEPEALAAQARVMADHGCRCVYVVDSAGAMVLDDVADRVAALVRELDGDAQVGFHAHRNLGVAEANTLVAVRAGAVQVDGSLRAFGAGAGNAQTELLAALLHRAGLRTGIDVGALLDVAETIAAPVQATVPVIDRDAITLGLSGLSPSYSVGRREACA